MKKKTDKSPLEQMREFLRMEGKVRIEGGELVIKDGIASVTPLKIVPIQDQDIDALAEKYTSEQIINDLEKLLYKCGLDNAKLIGKMTELKEQCLEDRGSDATRFAEWILHNADTDSNMWSYLDTDDTYKPKTTEQLYQLWQDSKKTSMKTEIDYAEFIGRLQTFASNRDTGREGCTYGDTDYNSLSATYGYNLALQHLEDILSSFTESKQKHK